MDIFGWLRRRVAQAFVDGIDDAVAAIESGAAEPGPPALPPRLTARLTLALAAPAEPEVEPEGNGSAKRRTR